MVAPSERQYRIEVGYGLEPVITNARSADIVREMVPDLQRGNYSAAVLLGVSHIAEFIAADSKVKLSSAL